MADLTLEQVIQASEAFYKAEEEFKTVTPLKLFGDVQYKIDSKLVKISHADFHLLLSRINTAIINAEERLEEIEPPIVKLLRQGNNTGFNRVWMQGKFTRATNTCLKKVHEKFESMIDLIRITQHSVYYCVKVFKKHVFGGKLKPINRFIIKVLKFNPEAVVEDLQEKLILFEQNIVQPLEQLPEINGPASVEVRTCIAKQYDRYMRLRLDNHNRIQGYARKLSTPTFEAFLK